MAKGKTARAYDANDVRRLLDASPNGRVTLALDVGESAWDSTRVGRFIWGPATVNYIRHPDGAVDTFYSTVFAN